MDDGRMDVPSRLARLLELANSGPSLRGALAEELQALLADWPPDCPERLRASCEALLARMRPKNALSRTLIEMARANIDIRPRLAEALDLPLTRIETLLSQPNGLAVIAKALGISRSAFSSLALLLGRERELDLYEAVTDSDVAATAEPRITRAA